MKLPKARFNQIITQEADKELLLYDLEINKAFCLNETSALVWLECDGTKSVAQISQNLNQKLKTDVTEDFVWLALDRLKRNNLLDQETEFEIDFHGLSRREVIKKVGLASMIALPLICSIVAPSALMAQSGPTNLALNSPCSSDGQCQSGTCAFVTTATFLFTNRCCLSDPAFAPGFILGACLIPSDCAAAASDCCSGMTTTQPGCPGAPTCLCA